MAEFAAVRAEMRQLDLRLQEDDGELIATSEIVLSDPYPPDAPETFFAGALIPMDILLS